MKIIKFCEIKRYLHTIKQFGILLQSSLKNILEDAYLNLGASLMDEDKRKIVMIVLVVCCLALAGGITFYQTRGGSSGPDANEVVYLKCLNKNCGEVKETTSGELYKNIDGSQIISLEMGPMRFECPACGKKSMLIAEKCPKCGTVFVPNMMNQNDFPDRCPNPDCKYSEIEERSKKK
jgi:predicted RNA-binding Zn-ribbon protein involved in translation (DUF1610 family)